MIIIFLLGMIFQSIVTENPQRYHIKYCNEENECIKIPEKTFNNMLEKVEKENKNILELAKEERYNESKD